MNGLIGKAVAFCLQHILIVFLLGLAAVLAVIGPFGTYEALSLWVRFAYWAPLVVGSYLFVIITQMRVAKMYADKSLGMRQAMSVITFSLTFSPFVWFFNSAYAGKIASLGSLFIVVVNIFGVASILGFLTYLGTRKREVEEKQARSPSLLYNRLPGGTLGSIVHLTVNDHYVDVYLDDGGQHRLLMRFADAVNEMNDTPGFCTHRSHWVAKAHVMRGTRENNREYLMLNTGAKVPVSKTYRENVEAAGFL